jgi:DNA invertase Pin-like site-specific DNA recombinase
MARKSKYSSNETTVSKKIWSVALYIRLSQEDEDNGTEKQESNSVTSQKTLLNEFIEEHDDLIIYDTYIDDGFTGTDFNRPSFQRLLGDMRNGNINCVIVKDLSRLGRNYIEVGNYIEQVFPLFNIRFIAINDSVDSFKNPASTNTILVPFKNLINDEYARDTSVKIRTSLNGKKKKGEFIGAFPAYGYIKDPEDITKLYVDEELRPVIELIYKLYTEEGIGRKKICDILNSKYNYPTPSVYYQMKHLERGRIYKHPVQKLWSTYMIRNILENDVYCGTLRTHKKKTVSIRGKAIKLPQEEHFVFENHHEAIISKDTFNLAQEIRKRKLNTKSTSSTRKRNYYFSGLCRCGDCGFGVSGITITRKQSQKGYECSQYRTYGKARCKCHEIKESDIIIHFKEFLKFTKNKYIDEINKIQLQTKTNAKTNNKEKIKFEIEKLNAEYKVLISQRIKDLTNTTNEYQREMIENTYKEVEKDKTNRIEQLQKLLEQQQEDLDTEKIKKLKTAIEYFDDILKSNEPNRYILECLIDKIWIYHDKSVKFELKPEISRLI